MRVASYVLAGRRLTPMLLALLPFVGACAKNAVRDASRAPGEATTVREVASPAGSLEALEGDLQAREGSLRALGVTVGPSPAEPGTPMGADDDAATGDTRPSGDESAKPRCPRVCDLAEAVCDLEGKICELADQHPDEDRYATTCQRARTDCERASEACRACTG